MQASSQDTRLISASVQRRCRRGTTPAPLPRTFLSRGAPAREHFCYRQEQTPKKTPTQTELRPKDVHVETERSLWVFLGYDAFDPLDDHKHPPPPFLLLLLAFFLFFKSSPRSQSISMVSGGLGLEVLCWINTDEPPGAVPALKALDRLVYWRRRRMLAGSRGGKRPRIWPACLCHRAVGSHGDGREESRLQRPRVQYG